jgi:hypothetical protein
VADSIQHIPVLRHIDNHPPPTFPRKFNYSCFFLDFLITIGYKER